MSEQFEHDDVAELNKSFLDYKLKKTVEFEGKSYSKLQVDFTALTGNDIITCERQYSAEAVRSGEFIINKEFNKVYLAYVVAKAANVPVELIRELPAPDFSRLTMRAQGFLLG